MPDSDRCPGCNAERRGIDCDCWDCPRCEQAIPGYVICACWTDEELREAGFEPLRRAA